MTDDSVQRKSAADADLAEANARKARAEADLAEANARKANLSALIPDLSAVKESSLQAGSAEHPMAGTGLSFGAVEAAAKEVATRLHASNGHYRILVTSESDLATATTIAGDVHRALATLTAAATALLDEPEPEPKPGKVTTKSALLAGSIAVQVAATLLPQVLSLFSAQRTLASGATTPADLAAVAAVAGALKQLPNFSEQVFVDDVRLVPPGDLDDLLNALDDKYREVIARKATVPKGDAASPADKLRLARYDALTAQIEAFNVASRSVPTGAKRSPLATAALYGALSGSPKDQQFTHVLLIKAQPGGWSQMEENRPLMMKDIIHQVVEANIAYTYIQTSDSQVVASGIATATRTATARIGEQITIL